MDRENVDLTDVLGLPKIYKGIEIYPIKIIDSQRFLDLVRCLIIEKNKTDNIQILKMSYLKFIIMLANNGHDYLIESLEELLNMVLKRDFIIDINEKGRIFIVFKNKDNIIKWTENDFDKVKKIIFKQNLIQMDEEILDPELEKKLNEAREFMSRRNGKMANLEQQIVAYHCAFKMKYEEICDLTIYQFTKGLQRMSLIKDADAMQKAILSGFVSLKDDTKLPNWLSYIEDSDPNEDLIMTKGELDKMAIDNGLINS